MPPTARWTWEGAWGQAHLPVIDALAPDASNQHGTARNVYALRATLLEGIERLFGGQHLLDPEARGIAFGDEARGSRDDAAAIAGLAVPRQQRPRGGLVVGGGSRKQWRGGFAEFLVRRDGAGCQRGDALGQAVVGQPAEQCHP